MDGISAIADERNEIYVIYCDSLYRLKLVQFYRDFAFKIDPKLIGCESWYIDEKIRAMVNTCDEG